MKKLKSKSESPSPNSTPITNSPPTPITTNSPPPATTPNSSDGVITRARTLAFENSNNQNQNLSVSSDSYLQLRNRRLKRPLIRQHSAKRNKGNDGSPKSPIGDSTAEEKTVQKSPEPENAEFGENAEEDAERSARETTPVHLIMRSDVLRPPRSITKRTFSTEANPRTEQPTIPISPEFEEYFAKHEAEQQREFMEKYNFDPVTEQPLPGRFEWEKVSP